MKFWPDKDARCIKMGIVNEMLYFSEASAGRWHLISEHDAFG
jgi:hypothetical protein